MNYLRERVAYIKGMAEGIKLDESTDERKLLKAIIDVMDDIALAVDDIEEVQESLSEQVDCIDEDLDDLESVVFDENEGYDEILGEFTCPHCSESVVIDEGMINEEEGILFCPKCGKKIEIEWECDCEDCSEDE